MPPLLFSLIFWVFAAITLVGGLAVIVNRNPVASALCLVLASLGLAGLYLSLDAYFLGVIQILVYAGAVMVLFLFIIMLLDLKPSQARQRSLPALAFGTLIAVLFASQIVLVLRAFPKGAHALAPLAAPLADAHNIGMKLFESYNLPLQVIGVLILVASIGVIVLSKRELN